MNYLGILIYFKNVLKFYSLEDLYVFCYIYFWYLKIFFKIYFRIVYSQYIEIEFIFEY